MHFSSRMIERRNAKENIVFSLTVMILLNFSRMNETLMLMKNSFRETCCSRKKK